MALMAFGPVVFRSDEPDDLGRVVDHLVIQHGTGFAAQAVVHAAGIQTKWTPRNKPVEHQKMALVFATSGHGVRSQSVDNLARRLRRLIAAGRAHDDVDAAIDELDIVGEPSERMAAFLSPTAVRVSKFVATECAIASAGWAADWMAATVISTPEDATALAEALAAWQVTREPGLIPTVVDGLGRDALILLDPWLNLDHGADWTKSVAKAVSRIPTDEAFLLLLAKIDDRYVSPSLLEAAGRFPVRATRLLAEASAGSGAAASAARDLLQAHVLGHVDLLDAARSELPEAALALVDELGREAQGLPDVADEDLPDLLVSPPWTGKRKKLPSAVIDSLVPLGDLTNVWKLGERERWSTTPTNGLSSNCYGPRTDWKAAKATMSDPGYRNQRFDYVAVAPEADARAVLPTLGDDQSWERYLRLPLILARFGTDALPIAIEVSRQLPEKAGFSLLPFASPEIAELMADWFVRLKSAQPHARAWLERHPEMAGSALTPAALAKAKAPRRAAESALRFAASGDRRSQVLAGAAMHGPDALAAIEALLDIDPLDVLPTRLPANPDWAAAAMLPQLAMRDRCHGLPRSASGHVVTMLAISKPGDVYAGLDVVAEIVDPTSLANFVWALFKRWEAVGMPGAQSWALESLGWFGDDDTVRNLAPFVRTWPGEGGHTRAVKGLDVLCEIGTDVALMHLYGISQKVKFKGVKEKARERVDEIASDLGLSTEELADRLVPDFGLDDNGSMKLDYGPRTFAVGFDESLKPFVIDEAGKALKALPKPGAKDDESLAPAAYKSFSGLKKDVRTVASDQLKRLERAMVQQRRWKTEDFHRFFVGHPLMFHIARRLIWAEYLEEGIRPFRIAEDRTLADVDDDTFELTEGSSVGIAHPIELDDVKRWSDVLADYETLQPFDQLGREIYQLTPEEAQGRTLERFEQTVPTTKLFGLKGYGFNLGAPQDAGIQSWASRVVDGRYAVVIDLDPGIPAGMAAEWPEQKLTQIWLNDAPEGTWGRRNSGLPFSELDALTASEVLRALTWLTTN